MLINTISVFASTMNAPPDLAFKLQLEKDSFSNNPLFLTRT